MSSTPRRLLAAVALAGALAGTTATTAHATDPVPAGHRATSVVRSSYGSLVFLKNYNVWIARADATGARPLTTDGTFEHQYFTPSQADNGLVVTGHGGLIYELTPSGRVVRTMDPPALKNSVGHYMDGTPTVAISPDGTLIAYTQSLFECPVAADCETRFATAYTATDHLTEPGKHAVTEYDSPSWIGDDRTVQGGGQLAEINLADVDAAPKHWFRDNEIQNDQQDLSDPAVSRDGKLVATIFGYGQHTGVLWSKVNGPVAAGSTPQLPTPLCQTNSQPNIASPAFSADSDTLAWTIDGNLWMTSGPEVCNQPAEVLAGASMPSFSAAPFTNPAPECVTAPRISGSAKVGGTLRASTGGWTMHPSAYAFRWLRAGHAIAGATHSTYHPTRADAGKRVSVQVTARGAGGSAHRTSASVKIANKG